jgi:hypothetical protein
MKQLIFIMVLYTVLSLFSCRRFRLDNIEIFEDPNQVVIRIDKGLE